MTLSIDFGRWNEADSDDYAYEDMVLEEDINPPVLRSDSSLLSAHFHLPPLGLPPSFGGQCHRRITRHGGLAIHRYFVLLVALPSATLFSGKTYLDWLINCPT